MEKLCQLPHVVVQSHNIPCSLHVHKILCCWESTQVPVPQEEEKAYNILPQAA